MRKTNLRRLGRLALTIVLLFTIAYLGLPTRVAQAVTIAEGFNSGVPAGWTRTNLSSPLGASQWVQCGTNGSTILQGFLGGSNSCVSVDYNSTTGSTGTISNWLITPLITTLKNNDIITFYTRTAIGSQNPDRIQVRLSTNGACSPGTTQTSVGDFSRLLVEINPAQTTSTYPESWTGYSATLTSITGTVSGCVGFRYFLTNAGPTGINGNIIAVDEFRYQDSSIPTPTRTATITPSPSPTRTPTPTATFTPSNTFTPSATFTLLPPHQDTIGVFKNGSWFLRNSNSAGAQDIFVSFNPGAQNLPVVGDWNGDGVDTVGIYDNFNGVFYLSDSNITPAINYTAVFGNPADTPLHGRWYNGALHDGIGVYRNNNGIIYLKNEITTGTDNFYLVLGNPGDVGIAGDWNYDGVDTVGVYRPGNQTWYLSNVNGNGITFSDIAFEWLSTNRIVAGDWNADGIMTVGYLTTNGVFSLHSANTTGAADNNFPFGPSDAYPVAGKWIAGSQPQKPGSSVLGNIPGTLRPNGGNPGGGD